MIDWLQTLIIRISMFKITRHSLLEFWNLFSLFAIFSFWAIEVIFNNFGNRSQLLQLNFTFKKFYFATVIVIIIIQENRYIHGFWTWSFQQVSKDKFILQTGFFLSDDNPSQITKIRFLFWIGQWIFQQILFFILWNFVVWFNTYV